MKLSILYLEKDVIIYYSFLLKRGGERGSIFAVRTQITCVSRHRCTVHCSSSSAPSFSRDFTWKWEDNFSCILMSTAGKWVELINFKITAKRLLPVTVHRVTAFMSLCCAYLGRRNCEVNMHFVFTFIRKDFMKTSFHFYLAPLFNDKCEIWVIHLI